MFHSSILLSALFGHALVFFIHLFVHTFFHLSSDCIPLQVFTFWAWCCLYYEFIVPSFFIVCISFPFLVILFPFMSACCCLYCLGMLLSFLFICWYFFVFPTLCMNAFCCRFFPFGQCCHFYEFVVPSSFCHLCFIKVSCNFISFHFSVLLSFLFGLALVFFIHHPLVLLCFPNFVYDCFSLWFFPLFSMVLSFFMSLLFLLPFVICVSSRSFLVVFPFISVCCFLFLFGHALVFFIHPLVLLCFNFVYDCISLWLFFLLGMVLSFLFIHCSFFFLSFACMCMIAFHCGLCTLLSSGHAVVFLILPHFISFHLSNQ